MKFAHFAVLSVIASLSLTTASVFADDHGKGGHKGEAMDPKKAEMMKKFMEYSTPGEAHKKLAAMAGDWKYTSTMWEGKDAKPEQTSGTATFKMLLGGRYLQQMVKGKAMGMPFEGISLVGYDNLKGKYDTIWIDSMGTGMVRGEGSFDEASKTLKDSGEFSCPMTDSKKSTYRAEWKFVDAKTMVYSMYGPGPEGGEEFKMMEMNYKRK